MNTKSILGLIVAAIIVVLLGVWLWKAPERAQAPVTTPVTTSADMSSSTTSVPATTAPATPAKPASSKNIISTKTIDGMKIEVTKEGTGEPIKSGQTAVMLYTGKLTDGSTFDSTASRNNDPFTFSLGAGQVIKGWDEGIVGMKVGEERTLTIPPELGYGANGYPPVIPQNATLIFDVTLVGIK